VGAVVSRLFALLIAIDKRTADGTQMDLLTEDIAHKGAVACIPDGGRTGLLQHLSRVAPLRVLEQIGHEAQMPQLIVKEALPDRLDVRILLVLRTAIIVIHLICLMQEPLLDPGLRSINDRLILGDMLLLNRGDLGIELPSKRVSEHWTNRHVVVMGLMFSSHDGQGMELG
jgi:hypothetical protein